MSGFYAATWRIVQRLDLVNATPTTLVVVVSLAFCVSCAPTNPGSTPPPGGTVDVLTGPRLLVVGPGTIVTLRRDSSLSGVVSPAMVLQGDATDLGSPLGMAVNGAGELIVVSDQLAANRAEVTINFYADATRLNGDQAPVRQVTATGIPTLCVDDIALDIGRDTLYILCELLSGSITVYAYEGTGGAGFDGNMAPSRELSITEIDTATKLFITTDDTLYMAGRSTVLAFESASTQSGQVMADRQIIGFGGSRVFGMFIDSADVLHALSVDGTTSLSRVADISLVDGDATILSRIEVLSTSFEKELVLDAQGSAYFSAAATIQIFDDVATLNGRQAPTREVRSDAAQLGGTGGGEGALLVID